MTDELIVVIDTSEQTPFFKKPPKGLLIVRDNLKPYGSDYSIRGFESKIGIERKNPDDLIQSLINDRKRFKESLLKLSDLEAKAIVVECELSKVLARCQPSGKKAYKDIPKRGGLRASVRDYSIHDVHPNSIKGSVESIEIKLGIPVHFALDRKDAERATLSMLRKYYDHVRGG